MQQRDGAYTARLLGAGRYADLDGQDTYVVCGGVLGEVVAYCKSEAHAEQVACALQQVADTSAPDLYDVWVTGEEAPEARGVTYASANFLVRALNCYDNYIGGEYCAYYTPAGKRIPHTIVLQDGTTNELGG